MLTQISLTIWRHWVTMSHTHHDIGGLVQERRNSSELAMELRLSCTNSSTCYLFLQHVVARCSAKTLVSSILLIIPASTLTMFIVSTPSIATRQHQHYCDPILSLWSTTVHALMITWRWAYIFKYQFYVAEIIWLCLLKDLYRRSNSYQIKNTYFSLLLFALGRETHTCEREQGILSLLCKFVYREMSQSPSKAQ